MAHNRQSTSAIVLVVGFLLGGVDVTVIDSNPEGDFVTDLTWRKTEMIEADKKNLQYTGH